MLFCKLPSNLRSNLAIRHLVDRFNTYDASTKVDSFKTFLEFTFCLTRTEYQNGFRVTNAGDDRIVVDVEMSSKSSLSAIICRYLLWFIGTRTAGTERTTGLFFNRRYYKSSLFFFAGDGYDYRLPVVNPQTHFRFHRVLLPGLHAPLERRNVPRPLFPTETIQRTVYHPGIVAGPEFSLLQISRPWTERIEVPIFLPPQ